MKCFSRPLKGVKEYERMWSSFRATIMTSAWRLTGICGYRNRYLIVLFYEKFYEQFLERQGIGIIKIFAFLLLGIAIYRRKRRVSTTTAHLG